MLSNFLKSNEVVFLTEKQQLNIKGGATQECRLTFSYAHDGSTHTESGYHYSAGQAGSEQARQDCVDAIVSGVVTRCSYNCEFDTWEQ